MTLLLCTVGASWPVVPEILAFTNPDSVPLLSKHPDALGHADLRVRWSIEPIEEVWAVATLGTRVAPGLEQMERWFQLLPATPRLKLFTMDGVAELATVEECRHMQELIFRCALAAAAKASASGGRLYLSLAGGRKTMSADMQLAAEHFGCDALLHVVDDGNLPKELKNNPLAEALLEPLPPDVAARFSPLVVRGPSPPRALFQIPDNPVTAERFPLPGGEAGGRLSPSTELADSVAAQLAKASDLMRNFATQLLRSSEQANFHALYSLPPAAIERLRQSKIGLDPAQDAAFLDWIRQLPKTELHCHFGGALAAADLLEIAQLHEPEIRSLAKENDDFANWLQKAENLRIATPEAVARDLCPSGWKRERDRWGQRRRHVATSALLCRALGEPQRIDGFAFGPLLNPHAFVGIGIGAYEAIGDLQGSSLMQTEKAIRAACARIVANCRFDGVVYAEIRCSRFNCAMGGLEPQRVVQLLRESLQSDGIKFKLVFIASRHGKLSDIARCVELIQELRAENPDSFDSWFAGLDLAGAEDARSPSEVRGNFQDALRDCLNVTIHAGEGESARNIWEAVYELNADRIGHGLTLDQDPKLAQRLRNRRVAVEMCPSSNCQIVGFDDRRAPSARRPGRIYPLSRYLEDGLRVCLNTDDPGMSRTTLSQEYLKAAWMSPEGLSLWEILQIVRNGFKAAFVSPSERKQLLLKAEERIMRKAEAIGSKPFGPKAAAVSAAHTPPPGTPKSSYPSGRSP